MTDNEIIHQALYYYQSERWKFAKEAAQKGFRCRNGRVLSVLEVNTAIDVATHASRLYKEYEDKVKNDSI